MVTGVEYLGQKYRSSVDFPPLVDWMEGEKKEEPPEGHVQNLGQQNKAEGKLPWGRGRNLPMGIELEVKAECDEKQVEQRGREWLELWKLRAEVRGWGLADNSFKQGSFKEKDDE